MSDFITQRSLAFFEILQLDHAFLDIEVNDWGAQLSYQNSLKIVKSLNVTNDLAERGVALVQYFNKIQTRDEGTFQNYLHVVRDHRQKFPDCSKKTFLANKKCIDQ